MCKADVNSPLEIQPFVDVLDINWKNCYHQKDFVFSKFVWKFTIVIIMIFLTTPTVS